MSDIFDPGAPSYPCVAFVGLGLAIGYDKRGKNDEGKPIEEGRKEEARNEVRYFRVSSVGDLEHINHMRRFKRWGVRSIHNMDKLKMDQEKKTAFINELEMLVNPPEMFQAAKPRKQEKA